MNYWCGYWNIVWLLIVNWRWQTVEIYRLLYNVANFTRAVIGRYPWSVRWQTHGWRHGKRFFFLSTRLEVLNMLGIFFFTIEQVRVLKNVWLELFTKTKNRETETKRVFDDLKMPNCKKPSQQLPSLRQTSSFKMFLQLFCFEQVKALKNVSEKLYTSNIIKEEKKWQRRKVALWFAKCLN